MTVKYTYAGNGGIGYTFTEDGIYIISAAAAAATNAANTTPSLSTNANVLFSRVIHCNNSSAQDDHPRCNNALLYIVKATAKQSISGIGAWVAGCVICKIN